MSRNLYKGRIDLEGRGEGLAAPWCELKGEAFKIAQAWPSCQSDPMTPTLMHAAIHSEVVPMQSAEVFLESKASTMTISKTIYKQN